MVSIGNKRLDQVCTFPVKIVVSVPDSLSSRRFLACDELSASPSAVGAGGGEGEGGVGAGRGGGGGSGAFCVGGGGDGAAACESLV